MAATVTQLGPKSIQGELFDRNGVTFMEQDEVDKYVDSATDDVLACRDRGRHLWPSIRKAGIVFTDVTDDGLLVRKVECGCCNLAVRVEFWEARTTGRGQNKNTRYVPVASSMEYREKDGVRYLGPQGHGRMLAKQVRESLATRALAGQTLTMVREAAKRTGAAARGKK